MKYRLTVVLNGTNENPYHRLGLTQNPFPQIAKYEWLASERCLAKLGGDPIPNEAYIRETLQRFSPEFVDLCCKKFQPGKLVRFDVEFNV